MNTLGHYSFKFVGAVPCEESRKALLPSLYVNSLSLQDSMPYSNVLRRRTQARARFLFSTSHAIGERQCHRQRLERRAGWRARRRALGASQFLRQRRARAPPRGICGNASGAVRREGPTSSTSGALARPRVRRPIHHSSARAERQRMTVHQVQRPRGDKRSTARARAACCGTHAGSDVGLSGLRQIQVGLWVRVRAP